MFTVTNLDTGAHYVMDAKTPYEALEKMLYTCNIEHDRKDVKIHLGASGRTAWFEHTGNTYAIVLQ